MKKINILLVIFLVAAGLQAGAQVKPIAKFKPPKLYTQMGGFRDSVTMSVPDAENILSQPLLIFDDKKGAYSISSYQFLYRKRGVTENEETGKVSPTTTIVSNRFKATPLTQTWIDNVREQVKPGEELYFFDVIVKDAQGRIMYAPDFKVYVKWHNALIVKAGTTTAGFFYITFTVSLITPITNTLCTLPMFSC